MGIKEARQDHPIEDTLREAAKILNLDIPPRQPYMTTTEALLLQAQIVRELARRIASLEDNRELAGRLAALEMERLHPNRP